MATPGDSPVRAVAVPDPLLLLEPGDRLPVPAGAPPPLPPPLLPGVCPPVSTVELTCTIACLNGGTTSAMLAMNATPASTAAGRSQAMPGGRLGLRCRGDAVWVAIRGSSANFGRGSSLGLGSCSGQTQWLRQNQRPRQSKCLA